MGAVGSFSGVKWLGHGNDYLHWSGVKVNKTGNLSITEHSRMFMKPQLPWKSNNYYIFWVCVCSLSYPACNAHAPHSHLWPVCLYNILPRYLLHSTIFGKKLLNMKCVFWFSLQLLSIIFLILRRNERDIIKNVHWSSYNTHYSCQTLMTLERSQQIFESTQISWKSV
jgi:hypothetical protein